MRVWRAALLSSVLPACSIAIALLGASSRAALAAERLCDPSFEDCRTPLIKLIRAEDVGIDVGFSLIRDTDLANEIIARFKAGVPVRAIVEPRRKTPAETAILDLMKAAEIPMRYKPAGGILHWKMMLFANQQRVQFGAANYTEQYFRPTEPYVNYIDEGIYFSDDPGIVNSFMTKYDDIWTNTTTYADFANITGPLTRNYPTFPLDPELNFVPIENFAKRSVPLYDAETLQIDTIMYKILDARHVDALIRAKARGVPVRLITEPIMYRDSTYRDHAYQIDRLHMAGIPIRHRAHLGFAHQKTTLLYNQGVAVFGSSNWTLPSASSQEEHNYFTTKWWFFQWFRENFERKWNNSTGNTETKPFEPLPPDKPVYVSPKNLSTDQPLTLSLSWRGGPWGRKANIYLGTDPDPLLHTTAFPLKVGLKTTYALPPLEPATTYYWRIVDVTAANQTASGPVWSFVTKPGP